MLCFKNGRQYICLIFWHHLPFDEIISFFIFGIFAIIKIKINQQKRLYCVIWTNCAGYCTPGANKGDLISGGSLGSTAPGLLFGGKSSNFLRSLQPPSVGYCCLIRTSWALLWRRRWDVWLYSTEEHVCLAFTLHYCSKESPRQFHVFHENSLF